MGGFGRRICGVALVAPLTKFFRDQTESARFADSADKPAVETCITVANRKIATGRAWRRLPGRCQARFLDRLLQLTTLLAILSPNKTLNFAALFGLDRANLQTRNLYRFVTAN